jgi:predicted unusual protein kinase regulating ubiquinone biosynthesis (AarF/ABC1/UbiB family)
MENKPQNSIPTSKVERAARFAKTGLKVGGNYVRHYARKIVDKNLTQADLDKENAADIYETLSELKGSALKVAQMMSMSEGVLPSAYSEKFKMSQYAAPPLSYPLVVKTFKEAFGKTPTEIFDTFSKDAVNAASIGQVHQAEKGGKKMAVKVQYPGVADSIDSDLKMVKPFAMQLLRLNEKDLELYMNEVGDMLKSETNYLEELRRSERITQACADIKGAFFPTYYKEYSSEKILTMDWLEGLHLDAFLATNPSQEIRNQVGQTLWDFYDKQMHELQEVHADPHPGNFLFTPEGKVGIIDFGCVKKIPADYYPKHFKVMDRDNLVEESKAETLFEELGFLLPSDTPEERKFFVAVFRELLLLTTTPFENETFDFGDDAYFNKLKEFGERLSKMDELRKSKQARGSQHALYLNRTYFGLYFILHELKSVVSVRSIWFEKKNSRLSL